MRVTVILWFLVAMPAFAMPTPVQDLPTGCLYNNASVPKTYDSTSGVCRTIRFTTTNGDIQVLVCDKIDHYELYRQAWPATGTFRACVGAGSVDQISGFSSFTSTVLACGGPPPLVDPNSAGFANESRAANHARLLDAWWTNSSVVQSLNCPTGSCAWVPWYDSTSVCNGNLKNDCGLTGSPTLQQNCMVSDELSQVFLATAQGTNEVRIQQLVRMADAIRGSRFGSLPAWKASHNGDSISIASSNNGNTASDADARVIIALYTAAGNSSFSAAARADFRSRADAMAADFLRYDFVQESHAGRNGVQIFYWLASGGQQAISGFSSSMFDYAGYFGDAVVALLAAYRSTGNQNYLNAARDTVNAYLLAASFNGSAFSVPPMTFHWNTGTTPFQPVCEGYCTGQWDYADAPRAVSICKARYYAQVAGTTLPADLTTYCNAWMNSGGLTSTSYQPQYYWNGTPVNPPGDGPVQNGLGLSLNFAANTGDLTVKLDRVGLHYTGLPGVWDHAACYGVYFNAFFPINLGSAIGRDLGAFTAP